MELNGGPMLAWLDVDRDECERRADLSVGAVTSNGLLHGLWLLPHGLPVCEDALPVEKVRRFRDAPFAVVESGGVFERTYAPIGAVRAVAFGGRCWTRAVTRAIRFTPIVQRIAVVYEPRSSLRPEVALDAMEWGVGAVLARESSVEPVLSAGPAVVGAPSVYRWLLAELAFDAWCQENAQYASCFFSR